MYHVSETNSPPLPPSLAMPLDVLAKCQVLHYVIVACGVVSTALVSTVTCAYFYCIALRVGLDFGSRG